MGRGGRHADGGTPAPEPAQTPNQRRGSNGGMPEFAALPEALGLFPPDFVQAAHAKYLTRGYKVLLFNALPLLLLPPMFAAIAEVEIQSEQLVALWRQVRETHLDAHLRQPLVLLVACVVVAVGTAFFFLMSQTRPVYLMDFALYRGKDDEEIPHEVFCYMTANNAAFTDDSKSFQSRVMAKSGLGHSTYLPPAITRPEEAGAPSIETARREAEIVMFTAVEDCLKKCGITAKQVDILIVNCSLFNPTPSLSAMIVHHFKMRSNVRTYNLGGMGCSAGLISIDLAKDLLQVHRRARCLVVSTENITQNYYQGNDKSMLLPNTLFRVGGAAILLSNRRFDQVKAKYQLMHTVRTHMGADDESFKSVYQDLCPEGQLGVRLARNLVAKAGEALRANVTVLGPLVLPYYEQALFLGCFMARRVKWLRPYFKSYVPDFKQAFDHFCIHVGGKAVVEEVGLSLKLEDRLLQPSRATLNRFGNTSSSSVWYILGYSESEGRVRKGDMVWQIGFGSGFKVNSAVWKALKRVTEPHQAWFDYPSVIEGRKALGLR